ncbi:MAG TPA: DNA-directed RNA polymerase, subunit E'' [Candidatus Woesearchaeota archaeon]|nr:DNA-directed RNA polymerase, subunit E'' [Candidatus Woesearchaeota archaeon]
MVDKACKKCKRVTGGKKCPICGGQELTPHWRGLVVIVNPEKSEIAKKLNIELPGEYALKVR